MGNEELETRRNESPQPSEFDRLREETEMTAMAFMELVEENEKLLKEDLNNEEAIADIYMMLIGGGDCLK
ncbi:hypothetical protein [Bacillus sp. FJAT-50079]|uniref:hypothetical protein n=1 Tax=Bacillus sp. FJAT-50079 TaxID=2833577 RepID=UPI001BCA3633|nr:hypothetical protein [Bacillus sp. FJAT-50079]MBS4207506.1 hypothetical protein [Bacillus sp. FJAT-50079]